MVCQEVALLGKFYRREGQGRRRFQKHTLIHFTERLHLFTRHVQVEIAAKAVSTAHAILASVAGLVILYVDHECWQAPIFMVTPKQVLLIAFSSGYFL